MATDLQRRDLGAYALLLVVTLGFYAFYLVPKLGLSTNQLIKKSKYDFHVVLWVGILTCGIGLVVFEVMYAYDLEKAPEYTGGRWSNQNLGGRVLILNLLAWFLIFVSGGLAFLISMVLGGWATWLIQSEVNRYLELGEASAASS